MTRATPHIAREDILALIQDVTASITSSLDLEATLEAIVGRTAEALGVFECDLYEYDAAAGVLVASACGGHRLTAHDLAYVGTALDLAEHATYRAIIDERQTVEMHIDDPDLAPEEREQMLAWGEKSYISVPLEFQGKVIGCLDLVERGTVRHFTDDERETLRRLATPAAIALHNARMYRELEEKNRYLDALAEASRAITATMDLDEVLRRVSREARRGLDTATAAIHVYDEPQDTLVYMAVDGLRLPVHDPEPAGTVRRLAELPGERPILLGDGIAVEQVADPRLSGDRRTRMETRGELTVLSVPLRFRDERLGILRLSEVARTRHFSLLEQRFAEGLGELAGAAIHNARSFRSQEERRLELETLLEASAAMATSMDFQDVLDGLAERAAQAMGSPQCLIYEHDASRDVIVLRSSSTAHGFANDEDDAIGAEYPLDEFPSDRDIMRGGAIVEEHVSDPDLSPDVRESMLRWGEKACLTVPLMYRGEALGLMELIEMEEERRFSPRDVGLARALAEHAAVALNNARLYRESTEHAVRLEHSYFQTVTALATAMEAKDHYTAEHAETLAAMAVCVGRLLGLGEAELRDLRYASVLHDIGKIGVPGHILNKPGRLDDDEFAVMAQHTVIGQHIISAIEYLTPVADVIRAAHERWDGTGYPDGIGGEQIPLAARILFVCDAYHAMTSDRPYRSAMPDTEAMDELRRNAGTQFDPRVVQAFEQVWPHFDVPDPEPAPGDPV